VPGRTFYVAVLVAYAAAIVAIVILADTDRAGAAGAFVASVPAGDKVAHLVLFGVLAFLVNAARPSWWRLGRFDVPVGSAIVLGLCALEELSQLAVATRTADYLDLGADTAGILLIGGLAPGLRQRRPAGATARDSRSTEGRRASTAARTR
jgi:hypothetical protein